MTTEHTRGAPIGYAVHGSLLVHGEDTNFFALTNRSFRQVDRELRAVTSRVLQTMTETQQRPVRVLDAGGGRRSRAAHDVAEKYTDSVIVFNSDLMAQREGDSPNMLPVRSSVDELPFKSGSIDIVYSHMLIPWLQTPSDSSEEDGSSVDMLDALSEMTRVLRPGGVCVTNNDIVGRFSNDDPAKEDLDSYLDAKVSRKDGGLFLIPSAVLLHALDPVAWSHHQIFVMQKEPIDANIDDIVNAVPDRLSRWRIM